MHEKVLIIEDEADIREGIITLLNEEGFIVYSASSGEQGVAEAKKYIPDIIICDIMMRGLDGYGVIDELSKNKETRTIPFIYLTAKVERGDFRKGMELGADDYLFKPFKPEELLNAMTTLLQKRSRFKADFVESAAKPVIKQNNKEKIFLNMGDKSCFVSMAEIVYISAENQYTAVYMADRRNLLIRKSVAFWEKTLPETRFVKVNRSTIINLDFIAKMGKSHNSSFIVYLKNIADPFVISRRSSRELRKRKFNK